MHIARSLFPSLEPRRSVVWALVTIGVAVAVPIARAADSPVLVDLLHRAGAETRRFEEQFTLVLSDENYWQHESGQAVIGFKERRTHADMLFLWVPQERVWLTVRNVLTVDGQTVAQSEGRLDEALHASGADRLTRLRGIINDNAKFNVGAFKRNFNYPTLALSFVDPDVQPRFRFSLAGRERAAGVDAWKVNYEERRSPTVIHGDGVDLKSRGSIWVARESGVVVRTLLELTISNRRTGGLATVTVDYQHNATLAMWVPAQMRETYTEMLGSAVYENAGGEATYSNFRRFETSARIVP